MSATTIARSAFVALALLGTFGLAPIALASHENEQMPSSYPALMRMDPKDVMQMMDVGKKGYVTREEFVKFQEALFDRLDRNGDRKLAPPEFTDRG